MERLWWLNRESPGFIHGECQEVSRIVRTNADSMIKELAEKGFCDMTQFTATEGED